MLFHVKVERSNQQKTPAILAVEKFYPYALAIAAAFFSVDVAINYIRPNMLPQSSPPAKPPQKFMDTAPARGTFNTIISRNAFSLDGKIPEQLIAEGQKLTPEAEQIPVPSQLPLSLIGTIVYSNAEKSIATIDVKGRNQILSFRPKMEIEGIATVVRVERQKVILRNLNNNRLEYIESKSANKISFRGAQPDAAPSPKGEEVQAIGKNQFAIKRAHVLKYTNNLAEVLQQARSVPNRNPVTGEIDGFRLLDFQPGSIYEKLGLQRMDVIKSVNGETVDSPAKAMELYNALKNSGQVSLGIERNGKTEAMDYQIQ